MAHTVSILVSLEDGARLRALIGDRNSSQKHVQRARIILHSAERLPVLEVARRSGVSRPAVWRWQLRYAEQGVDGLLRDKTRKPGRAPLPPETVAKVLALPCSEAPGNATHWTGRAVAKAVGVSLRAVQRIWDAHRLQPHRLRTFKRSRDPAFAEKVEDVVGLYMAPPCHAVVLSIDEKSQIQALDRTQPGLPLKPGKCATMTHDYKRTAPRHCSPRSMCWTAPCSGDAWASTGIRSSSNFSMPWSGPCQWAKSFTPSSTTTPPTSTRRSSGGWPITRAGCFTSPQHRRPGSTPSKASSQPSLDDASDAASSDRSQNWRKPSADISRITIDTQGHSSGPKAPIRSCKS